MRSKQDVSFIHGNVVNLYISYKLDTRSKYLDTYFTLPNYLFRVVKLTKNIDTNNYKYIGYDYGYGLMHVHNFHGKMG